VWPSGLGSGRGDLKLTIKISMLWNITRGLGLGQVLLNDRVLLPSYVQQYQFMSVHIPIRQRWYCGRTDMTHNRIFLRLQTPLKGRQLRTQKWQEMNKSKRQRKTRNTEYRMMASSEDEIHIS
jgi:hypothetical protein